jgi:hypothetical protein
MNPRSLWRTVLRSREAKGSRLSSYRSPGVCVDRCADHAVRFLLTLEQGLDALDGLGSEELFAGLLTYPGRYAFDNVEAARVEQGVGYFGFD